jgi:acid phosphatase (class A)
VRPRNHCRSASDSSLLTLLTRVSADSSQTAAKIKDRYQRKSPFLLYDGPICLPRTAGLEASFDYPSGHATMGWATGLIL